MTRTFQVVVTSINEKSTEDSSSNDASADKSDEEDNQELKEEEIQEQVEDIQESLKGGVQEATKEAMGDKAVTLKLSLIDIPSICFLFLLLLFVCNDGVPPRVSNEVLFHFFPINFTYLKEVIML